jgi:hypothetical protein
VRGSAGQPFALGLAAAVGDPGLGEFVADGGVRVHRGLLGDVAVLYLEDPAKAARRGSGIFPVFVAVPP